MAVSAELIDNRDCYSITYDNSTGDGVIKAEFENQADGDKSAYRGVDDGTFIVTVAPGYTGVDNVVISKDGDEIDSGEVTFGDA